MRIFSVCVILFLTSCVDNSGDKHVIEGGKTLGWSKSNGGLYNACENGEYKLLTEEPTISNKDCMLRDIYGACRRYRPQVEYSCDKEK